jgi:hypothetical protein
METTISILFIAIAAIIVIGGAAITIYKNVHKLRADGTPKEK